MGFSPSQLRSTVISGSVLAIFILVNVLSLIIVDCAMCA